MQANCTGLAKRLLNPERGSTFSSTAQINQSTERTNKKKTNTKVNIHKKVRPFAAALGYFTQSTVRLPKIIFSSPYWTSTEYLKHSNETLLYMPLYFTVANTNWYYSKEEHLVTEKDPSRSFQIYFYTRGYLFPWKSRKETSIQTMFILTLIRNWKIKHSSKRLVVWKTI